MPSADILRTCARCGFLLQSAKAGLALQKDGKWACAICRTQSGGGTDDVKKDADTQVKNAEAILVQPLAYEVTCDGDVLLYSAPNKQSCGKVPLQSGEVVFGFPCNSGWIRVDAPPELEGKWVATRTHIFTPRFLAVKLQRAAGALWAEWEGVPKVDGVSTTYKIDLRHKGETLESLVTKPRFRVGSQYVQAGLKLRVQAQIMPPPVDAALGAFNFAILGPWTEYTAEQARKDEEEAEAEEARKAEEQRQSEVAFMAEEDALAEEVRSAERSEEARQAELVFMAREDALSEAYRTEERARMAEASSMSCEDRLSDAVRSAEKAQLERERGRLAQEDALAEQVRLAERAEEARKAEWARRVEIARMTAEDRLAGACRSAERDQLAEEARQAEKIRMADQARMEREDRLAQKVRDRDRARAAEDARRIEQVRKDKEASEQEALRAFEEARKADLARLAEAVSKAQEDCLPQKAHAQATEEAPREEGTCRIAENGEKRREDEDQEAGLPKQACQTEEVLSGRAPKRGLIGRLQAKAEKNAAVAAQARVALANLGTAATSNGSISQERPTVPLDEAADAVASEASRTQFVKRTPGSSQNCEAIPSLLGEEEKWAEASIRSREAHLVPPFPHFDKSPA